MPNLYIHIKKFQKEEEEQGKIRISLIHWETISTKETSTTLLQSSNLPCCIKSRTSNEKWNVSLEKFLILPSFRRFLPEVKRHRCIVTFDSTALSRHKGVIGWKKRPLFFVFRTNSVFQFEISLRCSPFDPINASSKQIFLLKCLEFNSSR